jgi:hypothetical protein
MTTTIVLAFSSFIAFSQVAFAASEGSAADKPPRSSTGAGTRGATGPSGGDVRPGTGETAKPPAGSGTGLGSGGRGGSGSGSPGTTAGSQPSDKGGGR